MIHSDQSIVLLSNVLDAATEVSIIAIDPQGIITVFNRGAELLLGYSAEQVVGKHTPALFHLASEIAVRSLKLSQEYGFPVESFRVFVQNAETHGREQQQWTYVCADGRQVQVSLIITVMRSVEGNITGYLGIAHDITKEIEAYRAVKEFKNMLDQVHDGIFMFRPDTLGFTYVNHGATIQLGYSSEELLQMCPLDIKPEFTETGFRECLRPLLDGDKTLVIFETVHRCKDGHVIHVEVSIQLVSEQGHEPLFVNVVRDITERKRMDLMKIEFVSTVSHELRTPLTSISGALGLIVGGALGELPEQAKFMLDIALKNSKRLALLINDLLDMEKLAAGKMQLDLQLQLLMPLVEQTLEAVRAYGDQYQVRFELVERADDVQVRVDSGRLQQVLSNFLSNAAKFSPSGAQVEVAVRLQQDVVQVEVIDHGPGIPDEFRSRIFQKFSQADSSDTRQKGGTGLGLAISKELIERMNGLIGFDSEESRGARFYFQLPVWRTQEITQQFSNTLMRGAPRLLVVEDDPNIASLLSIMLHRSGYQVDVAASGETALNYLAHNKYVAMTLGLMLPDQSGVSLINRIRSQAATEELPIIVISAYTEEGKLALNGDFNAIDWIDKPFEEEQLISALCRFLPTQSVSKPRILHIEDDAGLQHVVAAIGRDVADFDIANNLAEARAKLALERYDLVVLDIGLPDGSGWELLADLKRLIPEPPVIVLSGSETTAEQQGHVHAALVKARIPNQDLLDTLKRLLAANT